jgi:hypothetical protein
MLDGLSSITYGKKQIAVIFAGGELFLSLGSEIYGIYDIHEQSAGPQITQAIHAPWLQPFVMGPQIS